MEVVVVLAIIIAAVWLLRRRGNGQSSEVKDYSSPDEPTGRAELSPEGKQSVAGESHYQPALKALTGGRTVARDDFDAAIHAQATLVPEPRNPYGDNAVRVEIAGRKVGYLPREDAADYRPVLDRLWQDGALGTCPARIMGGGKRPYGVFLHLAPPERIRRANSARGVAVADPDRSVAVSRSRDHLDVLEAAVQRLQTDASAAYPPFVCQLVEGVVATGKYQGERCIEVQLDGQRIGELTQTRSERYWHLLDGDAPAGCEVLVTRKDDDGLDVKARLPAVSN